MSSASPMRFPEVLSEIESAHGLSPATARKVFDAIFSGEWTSVQIGAFLIALRVRGESVGVVKEAASALRSKMVRVEHSHPRVLDTCGTGGDGQGSINISTAAAIVLAACGLKVAKHGNRAASSQTGTADVLSELGIPLDTPPQSQGKILDQCNIAFLFARQHHPAMRFAGPPRSELGVRTLFNLLGPLANPAGATHQLIGAFSDTAREMMAQALASLGTEHSWVVHSSDGLDEISPFGETRVSRVRAAQVEELVVTPQMFGLSSSPAGAIRGGDPAHNARVLREILAGKPHPARDAVVLNAGAALVIATDEDPKAAAQQARDALDSGRAAATLERWAQACANQAEG